MCYSAMVWAEYRAYVHVYGADINIHEYFEMYVVRASASAVKTPKAMDASFANSQTEDERRIKALIDEYDAQQATKLQQELFKQSKRLADANRTLQTKTTKAALESQRIAGNKIEWAKGKLADLNRKELKPSDSRIYPGYYAPVMIWQDGRRQVVPMRYQCRPAGKPAFYDERYPGTYNARRDNLEGFWKAQFGYTHGLIVANAFYEHVSRPGPSGEDENVILEFRPNPQHDMLIACLWSRWQGAGEPDLLSFAAITDEPPAEVAAAGHDRCIIPIRPESINAWLRPDSANLAAQYAILDDRERPYYEHRMAA
jgi:putative SOS response-associated peptidase YedK